MNHGSSFAELERLSPLPVSEEDFPLESVEIDDIYDDGDDNDDCNDNNVEGKVTFVKNMILENCNSFAILFET